MKRREEDSEHGKRVLKGKRKKIKGERPETKRQSIPPQQITPPQGPLSLLRVREGR